MYIKKLLYDALVLLNFNYHDVYTMYTHSLHKQIFASDPAIYKSTSFHIYSVLMIETYG